MGGRGEPDAPRSRTAPWRSGRRRPTPRGRSPPLLEQDQRLDRAARHRVGRGRDHPVGRLRRQRLRQAQRPQRGRDGQLHDLVVGARAHPGRPEAGRPRRRRWSSRTSGSRAARSPCRSSTCSTSASATCSSGSSGCGSSSRAEGLFAAERKKRLPVPPAPHRPDHRARTPTPRRTCCATRSCAGPQVRFRVVHAAVQGDRTVPEVTAAIRTLDADPEVEVIIVARGGGDFQNLLGFSDERLVRAAAARVDADRQRDRPRGRPAAARRGRRPARIHADRRGEARRAGRRGGAGARAAGARPHRHARHAPHRRARSTASGTCARGRRSRRRRGSSTRAREELTRYVARGAELVERCVDRETHARRPSCAGSSARSRRRARSTAATRSCRPRPATS